MKKIVNIFNKILAIKSGIIENISSNNSDNYQLEDMDFIDIEKKTDNKTAVLNIEGVLEPRLSFLSFSTGVSSHFKAALSSRLKILILPVIGKFLGEELRNRVS